MSFELIQPFIFPALIGLSVFGVVAIFVFRQSSDGDVDEKKNLQNPAAEKKSFFASLFSSGDSKAPDRSAERKRGVQNSLRDMENRQKAMALAGAKPSLTLRLIQSGLGWNMVHFIIFTLIIAGIAFGIAVFNEISIMYSGIIAAIVGFLVPRWYVNRTRNKRFEKFLKELPTALDVIVRGIKSGLPVADCIRIIADEANEPVKTEFSRIVHELSLGVPLAEAAQKLHERIPLPESNFFSIVIAIQSRAGGNLSEALANLSKMTRERHAMKAKIQAVSQEAKSSAAIIGSLPFGVVGLIYLVDPDYIMTLINTTGGNMILAVSAFWMGLGIFAMKKMINFDF